MFSGVMGCSLGAVERSARRPLSIVERDRPRGRKKRCPTQAGSALSRARFGCGVGNGRFFWPRGRGFLALSDAKGALRAKRRLNPGDVKNVRGLGDHTAAGRKARPQSRARLRGRGGAGRGPESATGRQAAVKQVAPSFTRSGTLGASCRRPCSAF